VPQTGLVQDVNVAVQLLRRVQPIVEIFCRVGIFQHVLAGERIRELMVKLGGLLREKDLVPCMAMSYCQSLS
jgi:hypothetical protein